MGCAWLELDALSVPLWERGPGDVASAPGSTQLREPTSVTCWTAWQPCLPTQEVVDTGSESTETAFSRKAVPAAAVVAGPFRRLSYENAACPFLPQHRASLGDLPLYLSPAASVRHT